MSCLQTVLIHMPFSPYFFNSMEEIPILPTEMQEVAKGLLVRQVDEGVTTMWFPSGHVNRYMADGTIRIWYPKPTINDLVLSPAMSSSFQFHTNGAVTGWYYGAAYYWSPPIESKPVDGPFETAYWHVSDGWVFESEETCEACYRNDSALPEDYHYYRYGY